MHNVVDAQNIIFPFNDFPFQLTLNFADTGYFLVKEIDCSFTGGVGSTRSDAMVNREGLCTVDGWPSDIGSRAEKRVNKDGVLPLRLDLADRGPFKYEIASSPSRRRAIKKGPQPF